MITDVRARGQQRPPRRGTRASAGRYAIVALLALSLIKVETSSGGQPATPAVPVPSPARVLESFGRLPITFSAGPAGMVAHGTGYAIALGPQGAQIALSRLATPVK